MIPQSILRNLAGLRRRERFLQMTWGLVRWLAIFVGLLVVACSIDYIIDRTRETPLPIRRTLLFVELAITVLAGLILIAWPLRKRLSDEELALSVEEKYPQLQHRLISAIQLNRKGADVAGMSPELIRVVTQEAQEQAKKTSFAQVADMKRLRTSLFTLAPIVLIAALPFVLFPQTTKALLARHFLASTSLPRDVELANMTLQYWPAGEKVMLKLRARGDDQTKNPVAHIDWKDTNVEYANAVELSMKTRDLKTGESVYVAEIGPFTSDFTFTVRLGDGRLPEPGIVEFVPRPMIVQQEAWVQLPAFCGTKPNGLPYEKQMPRGEVVGIAGSSARVLVKIQKPVERVTLQLLNRPKGDKKSTGTERRTLRMTLLHPRWQVPSANLPLALGASLAGHLALPSQSSMLLAAVDLELANKPAPEEGSWAQAIFVLQPDENLYRITAFDEYGFPNKPVPERSIRMVPEDPPTVTLLRELFPPLGEFGAIAQDYEVEGLPLLPGVPIKVAYTFGGPYGVARANFLFRIHKQRESGNDPVEDPPWHAVPLPEVVGSPATGPFDLRRGCFVYSTDEDSIGFHAIPSPEPFDILGRTLGGGRYVFQTRSILPDGKGGFLGLTEGDQIEFCIEVFADRDPNSDRPSAKSETRVKNVVSPIEFARWIDDTLQEERRIRALDLKQRGLFGDIKKIP